MTKNKRFLLSALAFSVALAFVSCKPLTGRAVEIDAGEQFGIYDYLDTAGQNLNAIDFRLDSDEDGNRSVRLQIFGLQQLALQTQTRIYDNMDFALAPDTVTVSGSSYSGFYEYMGVVKTGTLYFPLPSTYGDIPTSAILYTCPDFTVSYTLTPNTSNPCKGYYTSGNMYSFHLGFGQGHNSYYRGNITYSYNGSFPLTYGSSLSYADKERNTIRFWVGSSSIPRLTDSTRVFDTNGYTGDSILGAGTTVNLPPGSSDTSRPWDYYNNTLLPYLRQTYPTYTDYFIFPDGYDPPSQPTTLPVEYPTLPGFDYALETNGTEPASEYNYNVPELPGKDIAVPSFDFTQINPAEIMAPVASGLSGLWALVTGVLTEYNLFPYVAIAVLAAIVAGIMHLGK